MGRLREVLRDDSGFGSTLVTLRRGSQLSDPQALLGRVAHPATTALQINGLRLQRRPLARFEPSSGFLQQIAL